MLKKQSYWLGLSYVLFILLSFGTLKFNLNSFGTHKFGIWLMLSSLWGFGGNLDLGIGFSMIKFISEYKDHDNKKLTGLLSSSLFLLFFLSIIIFLILYAIGSYYYLDHGSIWENIQDLSEFKTIFNFLSVLFILRYYTGFFKGIFEGFNRYVLTSKLEIVRNVSVFLIAGITWFLQKDMIFLVTMNLIVALIIILVYLLIFLYNYKNYFQFSFIKICHIKDLLKFSISIQLMNVFAGLIDPVAKYVIGNYYRVDTVSIYEIAKKFSGSVSGLFTAAFRNTLNDITVLKQPTEMDDYLNKNCLQLSKTGIVYSGFFFGSLAVFSVAVLQIFFNYEGIAIVYIMLSLCEAVNVFVYPVYIFLAGTGRALWLAFVQCLNVLFTAVFLYVGLSVFNNSFGFLALFVSVVMLNGVTFYYIWVHFNFKLNNYLILTGFYKLIVMIVLLLIVLTLNKSLLIPALFFVGIIIYLLHKTELATMVNKIIFRRVRA